ncbi:ATP-dependent protease ClpP protease subunit [Microvirga flocculans]|uniref:ATP-dependent Clp protease proteolytic subunit n=1 Tax=Microvirga flocculans TaxID=217168 RepID=A0A7W6IIB9_9HYPH|nr:head maturation protease, ClpP-related [Microvirga flocculans]MBB4042022.1 ATP-dependent protease ClpP protease subunit [Microvirga flocculans]
MSVLQNGELVLYGFVGENFWDVGFTAKEVVEALAEHGRDNDITVRINSGGGYVDDGVAIYNALAAHKGKVTVQVDSIAASSASLIAMAGDTIIMLDGSLMMIHDPSGITYGTADDHEKTGSILEKMASNMASIYAERSGNPVEDVRQAMKDELWLTADEAVEQGYADESQSAKAKAVAAFDFRVFANAPQRLTAMSKRKNWSLAEASARAAATARQPRQPREPLMTDKTTAAAPSAEIEGAKAEGAKAAQARIKAIMTADAAKGREKLAEHFAYETEMTAEAAIAALAVAPTAAAAPSEEQEPQRPSDSPEAYAARRTASAGLAAPGGAASGKPQAKLSASDVYANRRKAVKQGA